jgi:hypothetical protein
MSWERFDEEPEGTLRDTPPDVLTPIDPAAPVSGHRPAETADDASRAHSDAPEHDWAAAAGHVYPALRPAGLHGASLSELDTAQLANEGMKKHALALIDPGPADLTTVYVLRETAFDVVINADHLLTWGISPDVLRAAAMANLRSWSAAAPWTEEQTGQRRLLSSDTGEGADAARILLQEVRDRIAGECGGPARVLVALPDRDLLVAGSLHPGDGTFAEQLAAFVGDVSDGGHEPIDRRLFELVGDENVLVPFVA